MLTIKLDKEFNKLNSLVNNNFILNFNFGPTIICNNQNKNIIGGDKGHEIN